jgi:hypothetical protein
MRKVAKLILECGNIVHYFRCLIVVLFGEDSISGRLASREFIATCRYVVLKYINKREFWSRCTHFAIIITVTVCDGGGRVK